MGSTRIRKDKNEERHLSNIKIEARRGRKRENNGNVADNHRKAQRASAIASSPSALLRINVTLIRLLFPTQSQEIFFLLYPLLSSLVYFSFFVVVVVGETEMY